jgi:thiazole synthase ThiGH ThiG subunit
MIARNTPYSFRRVGTCGCEILAPTGSVVAWTVDDCWAATIVRLLNETAHSGVAVVAGLGSSPEATGRRYGHQQPTKKFA